MYGAWICQLGKENILSSLYKLSCYFHCSAHSSLPERKIKYMMQAKWNQSTLDNTEDQCSEISGSRHQSSQCVNSILHKRPYKKQKNSDSNIYQSGNNRYKPGATEEGQRIRQRDFVILIVKRRHAKSDDNPAEHTHLQCLDTKYTCDRTT